MVKHLGGLTFHTFTKKTTCLHIKLPFVWENLSHRKSDLHGTEL